MPRKKKRPTHAYQPWTPEEDTKLLQFAQEGILPDRCAMLLRRTRGAVLSRLRHLRGYPTRTENQA